MPVSSLTTPADPGDLPAGDLPALERISTVNRVGPVHGNKQPRALEKRTLTLIAKVNEIIVSVNTNESNITSLQNEVREFGTTNIVAFPGATITGTYSGAVNNTFVGRSAGLAVTSGDDNTGAGYRAGFAVTTGSRNCFYGSTAGDALTTGSDNVIIGDNAAGQATDGQWSVVIGSGALDSMTTGMNSCTVIGYNAGSAHTSGSITIFGAYAAQALTGGAATGNSIFGASAFSSATSGSNNTILGSSAALNLRNAASNSALGFRALYGVNQVTTAAGYSVAVGANSLENVTVADFNTAVGYFALNASSSGQYNTGVGANVLTSLTTGSYNTAVGVAAGGGVNTFSNTTCLGYQSAVTASNQVQLGDAATTTYAYGAVQNRSDIRDKADVRDTVLGLDFIAKLRPVDFKWNYREDYYREEFYTEEVEDDEGNVVTVKRSRRVPINNDGSKKRSRYHHGLIAQDVEKVIQDTGVDFGGFQHHAKAGGKDVMSIGYEELIGPLIKAVQELKAQNDELRRRVSILEGNEPVVIDDGTTPDPVEPSTPDSK